MNVFFLDIIFFLQLLIFEFSLRFSQTQIKASNRKVNILLFYYLHNQIIKVNFDGSKGNIHKIVPILKKCQLLEA